MLVRTEVARAAVYAAGAHLDEHDLASYADLDRGISGAKVVAGDAAIANGKAATQVFGGMGFTWEVDVHLYLKRAWVLDTHFGTADEHADVVAGALAAQELTLLFEPMTRPQTTVLEALAKRLDSDPDGPYLDFANIETGNVAVHRARRWTRRRRGSRTRWPGSASVTATASRRCSTTGPSRWFRSSRP